MMTKKMAERLTGYEIRPVRCKEQGRVTYGAFQDEELIAETTDRTEELALKILVGVIYRIHCFEALKRHDGRCARCRAVKRLQIHHRRYRSHGGTHRIENLEPVCWQCHRMIHTLERSQ